MVRIPSFSWPLLSCHLNSFVKGRNALKMCPPAPMLGPKDHHVLTAHDRSLAIPPSVLVSLLLWTSDPQFGIPETISLVWTLNHLCMCVPRTCLIPWLFKAHPLWLNNYTCWWPCKWVREGSELPGTSVSQTVVTNYSHFIMFLIFEMKHTILIIFDLLCITSLIIYLMFFFLKITLYLNKCIIKGNFPPTI